MLRFSRLSRINPSLSSSFLLASTTLPTIHRAEHTFNLFSPQSFTLPLRSFATGKAPSRWTLLRKKEERAKTRLREREEQESQQSTFRSTSAAHPPIPFTHTDRDTPLEEIHQEVKPQTEEVVLDRLQSAYRYILGGVGITGASAALFFKTGVAAKLASMGMMGLVGIPLFTTLPLLVATMLTNYHKSPTLKHLTWGGFVVSSGLSIGVLGLVTPAAILFKAGLATAFTVGGLSVLGMRYPPGSLASWQKPIMVGLMATLGVGVANIFWPSPLLHNALVYGGLLLFGAATVSDSNQLVANAKELEEFDPVNESLNIYLNFINIFVRFVEIIRSFTSGDD